MKSSKHLFNIKEERSFLVVEMCGMYYLVYGMVIQLCPLLKHTLFVYIPEHFGIFPLSKLSYYLFQSLSI